MLQLLTSAHLGLLLWLRVQLLKMLKYLVTCSSESVDSVGSAIDLNPCNVAISSATWSICDKNSHIILTYTNFCVRLLMYVCKCDYARSHILAVHIMSPRMPLIVSN